MLSKLIEETVKEFDGIVEHVCGFPDESKKVVGLAKTQRGWHLSLKGGQQMGPFDFVVGAFAQHCLTDPFLLSGGQSCEKMLKCLRRVESNQLIPMQVSFAGKPIPSKFCAAHVYEEPALSFISNNSQKPQQNGEIGTPGPAHWTLLSTADFAERQFNCNSRNYKRVAEEDMLAAFGRVLGIDCLADHRPVVNRINHWEDGLPTKIPPSSRGCLFDAEQGLGWCGDFCVLPGIQGAALSGAAMAEIMAEFISSGSGAAFDGSYLLPSDVAWVPVSQVAGSDDTLMDMGTFSSKIGLTSLTTHTSLVPSAVDGYNAAAHTGHAGKGKGAKSKYQHSDKGKGKSKGYARGKGKNW